MKIAKNQKSEGDEVLSQLKHNGEQYTTQKNLNDPNIPILTDQNQLNTLQTTRPLSFDQIKLVSSLQEAADGHINPVRITCKGCKKNVTTVITQRAGKGTYKAACILLLCSFGVLCVACLPFYMEDCQDVIHTCPECKLQNGKTPFELFN